jgi:aerobic-type carbon monoxide dehydrogenase small subunit (CoxS/CutS family)
MTRRAITLSVNGQREQILVEPRRLLCDALRDDLGLTGTHVGCEHGVCGACTILVDGRAERSCMTFAVQADGAEIRTVEGLASSTGELSALQQAMWDHHGLQCGFCTPGVLMAMTDLLDRHPNPTRDDIRTALAGNICRCTGYETIVDAVESAAAARAPGR